MGTTRLHTLPALDRIGNAEPSGSGGTIGLVIGPGGSGKTRLLDDLASRSAERGQQVSLVAGSMYGNDTLIPETIEGGLLLVDDAHFLDPSAAMDLLRVVEDRNRAFDVCVAMRPVANEPMLGRLVEIAERRGALVELGAFTDQELGAALSEHVDGAVDATLFDAVRSLTLGQPLLVDRIMTGWVQAGSLERGRLAGTPEPAPMSLERALLGPINQLDEDNRHLLAAHCVHTLDDAQENELSGDHDSAVLVSHGLVGRNGAVAPSLAHAALRILDAADIAAGELLLAAELIRGGADPVQIAERFWTTSASGDTATAAWIAAGDALLDTNPVEAAVWYGRANQTAPAADTLARRAVALAAAGDDQGANQAIADVLRTEPRNARTLGASARLAAAHGRWPETSELLEAIDTHPRWSLSLVDALNDAALLIGGQTPSTNSGAIAADPAAGFLEQAVHALRLSLEHTPDTPSLTNAIRSLATRSGSAPVSPDLPVNAFELGAVAALAAGELHMAELLLTSAGTSVSGAAGDALHNWLMVRTGRAPAAGETLVLTDSPYVGLLNLAADAAHARRNGDVAAGSAVLDKLRQVVALAPIDALTLDAAAELLILARRFGSRTIAQTLQERIERFLSEIGHPPLWTARFLWSQVQTAIGTRDLELARSAARGLKELGPTGPRLTPLIEAAAVWVDVLDSTCTLRDVMAAADELEQNGYGWDAANLVGQAAIRMTSTSDAKQLLNHARELRGAHTSDDSDTSTAAGLSEREIEVGELILDGHSYKEIGSRLFISAKTVEHHASHIRRKLDATGVPRAAFLAALRTDLTG